MRRGGERPPAVKQYGKYERVDVKICFTNADPIPFVFNAAGRVLDHFEAGGRRFVPAPERDWDCEVTD